MSERRPGPDGSSDDTREREPIRGGADQPAAEGTRSDHAGTSGTLAGVTPGGAEAVRDMKTRALDREGDPPAGQATGAEGG